MKDLYNSKILKIKFENIFISFITIFFSFVILLTKDFRLHLFSFWIISFTFIYTTKFDILHPRFWFPIFFTLYSTSNLIIVFLSQNISATYDKEVLLLPLVALVSFTLFSNTKKNNIDIYEINFLKNKNVTRKILKHILFFLISVIAVDIIFLFLTGFTHKNSFLEERNLFFLSAVYSLRFMAFYIIPYLTLSKINNISQKRVIASVLIVSLAFSLCTGERDAFLRMCLILIFVQFGLKNLKKAHLPLWGIISILGLIILTSFKYYIINSSINQNYSIQLDQILISFLNTDFFAAGSNLQTLLDHSSWTKSSQSYFIFFQDIISPFFKSQNFFNIAQWFNDTFYYSSYSRAFTIVGQGYVIHGYIGVILIFSLLGLCTKFLYRNALKNEWYFAAYIYFIPLAITSFRSTFATIPIGLFRICFLGFCFIYLIKKIKWTTKQNYNLK